MNSKGFTLIELIVVIVILGILAVTAVPKFINLKAEAQTATLQGVKATMQGAAAMVHSKSLVKGNQKLSFTTINIGDGKGTSSDGKLSIVYGYPFASETSWKRLMDIDDNFAYLTVDTQLGSTLIISLKGSPTPSNFSDPCILYYRVANLNTQPQYTLNECV